MESDTDLYDKDIVVWCERQAEALRALRAQAGTNAVDWDNLIEEVEALGRSETRAVESLITRALEHMVKSVRWPDHPDRDHWLNETVIFLSDAQLGFTPSMRQKIDLSGLYTKAARNVARLRSYPVPAAMVQREWTGPGLDILLSDDFNIGKALEMIGKA